MLCCILCLFFFYPFTEYFKCVKLKTDQSLFFGITFLPFVFVTSLKDVMLLLVLVRVGLCFPSVQQDYTKTLIS